MNTIFETPISFLKPEYLLEAEEKYDLRQIEKSQLEATQDKAISDLVNEQERLGYRKGELCQSRGMRQNIYQGGLRQQHRLYRFLGGD